MKKFLMLLFILGMSLFFTTNTFALDDISETYNDGASHVICASGPGWNGFTSCDGYNYIIITSTGVGSSAELAWNASINFGSIRIGNADTIIINKPLVTGDYLRFSLSNYSSGSYTITLSEDAPGAECPPPPTPEPCEDPEENSQFIKVVIDAFWKYHQVFAGCVAALIAIFVLYRIIKGAFR